jgi:hypothetical protein
MIYITQLIYLIPGSEEIFHQFEDVAIPIISRYNGKLMLRIRPTADTVVEAGTEVPYEIHLVSFDTEKDFGEFKMDRERKKFLHLKEQSIKSVLMIQGRSI